MTLTPQRLNRGDTMVRIFLSQVDLGNFTLIL